VHVPVQITCLKSSSSSVVLQKKAAHLYELHKGMDTEHLPVIAFTPCLVSVQADTQFILQ
jgi:hypothetical protein